MATITPTNLRPPIQVHSNLYLSILVPEILLEALVNNGSIARGARTIAFDTGTGSAAGYTVIANAVTAGTSDNIGTSLMLEVDTTTGTEIVRVKSITGNEVSGTITVAENAINWADGQAIRIKHFFQISPIPPAIRSGIFYKDYDIAFASTYATQPNPVTVIGPHLAGFLSAGSIAFSLNSSSSYAIASGATISSRVWACVHNGGGTVGITFSSTTAANPTLTITQAGTYWLSCQITDSNGETQITYRAIFVYDADNMPIIDFTIQSLTGDWDSGQWRLSANLTGDITLNDIPDGTLAVIWYQNYFDGIEGYINVWSPFGNNIVYCGYLWSDNDQDDFNTGTGQSTFEVISPLMYLDSITDYGTVSLEAKTSPANWAEYASWLSVGRATHHLLKWDTTILEICDVLGLTDNTYGVKVCEFTEDTLLQRINGLANDRGIHARLISSRLGRLHLVADSQMLNTAARAALDTVFSITIADISGGVNVTRNETDIRAFADLDGFTYSHPTSTPYISMIPGYIESLISYNMPEFRGTGVETKKSQVLNSAGGQTDGNERCGRLLALANVSPKEIRVNMRGNYLGAFDIVPSIGWYGWGVADSALKRELPLNGILTICRSVTHQPLYKDNIFSGFIQTVEVVLQPQASGPDGIPGNYPTSYPAIVTAAPDWDTPAAGFGYWLGGDSGGGTSVVTADRIVLATGITAAYTQANLSVARMGGGGISDGATYGYAAGGFTTGATYVVTADRITFSSGVTAANSASDLSLARGGCGGISDGSTYGYFGGGRDAGSAYATSDRITFSTGVTAAQASANLSGIRHSQGVASDGATYGYWAGGCDDVTGCRLVTADRITFSTSTTAANAVSNLSVARAELGGLSDGATYGYFMGGYGDPLGVLHATTDRITFSSGATAAHVAADLSVARQDPAGLSDGTTYGYAAGGLIGGPAMTAITDRVTLATSVTAANSPSDLSLARAIWNNTGVCDSAI